MPLTFETFGNIFFETFLFIDWLTELLKMVYGVDAAGDLAWMVYTTFSFATLVLFLRFCTFMAIATPGGGSIVPVVCGCLIPSFMVPEAVVSKDNEKPTAALLGLPVCSAFVMLYGDPEYLKQFGPVHNRLAALQLVFEDLPDLIFDLIILTNVSDDEKGTVWFVLSLAWSVAGFVGVCATCTKGLMKDDGTLASKPPATPVGRPTSGP
eukprot:NODE_2612_length_906_cov_339.056404.p1 GENE.NODE_2612_length_906_cov_339.056404~~NODE_2612_length_906_cov_339.056404.p1  ORF type:complete len:209 (-),score=41.85 NODE_2612_length_906_cov_339.056404:130-756(-)